MLTMNQECVYQDYAHKMMRVYEQWVKDNLEDITDPRIEQMYRDHFLRTVRKHINTSLTCCGVPQEVKISAIPLPDNQHGYFCGASWCIYVNRKSLTANNMTRIYTPRSRYGKKKLLIDYGNFQELCCTVYHEARHCEQAWAMARYLAKLASSPGWLKGNEEDLRKHNITTGTGKPAELREAGCKYLVRLLHGEATKSICEAAFAKKPNLKRESPRYKLGELCYHSNCTGKYNRSVTIKGSNLNLSGKLPEPDPEEVDEDGEKVVSFHNRLHKAYKFLPEEEDAFATEALVANSMKKMRFRRWKAR